MRDDSLIVAFSAAHVRRNTDGSSVDAVAGYAQNVEMQFSSATWEGSVTECMGRLSNGRVISNGVALSIIELPFASTGPVSAELQFANGSLLSVKARELVCRFAGEPNFVEVFRC